MRTIASGLGSLENVLPDGTGGLLISASDQGAILRMTPDGKSTLFVPGVDAPGGMRIKNDILYFNTGDALQSGAQNTADGTIGTFDLVTQSRGMLAQGLTMPNGLAMLPNGDFVVSRDIGGSNTGITRVPASDPAHPQTNWAKLSDTNGMAIDPTGTYLYTDETFTSAANVYRILISDPSQINVVASLSNVPPKGPDDMTIDGSGILYIAANGAGDVIRLDPRDKSTCVIASGMRNTSAVKFGAGPGWPDTHLFVVGFDGVVRELTPPPDQTPVPPKPVQQQQSGPAAGPAVPMTLTARPSSVQVGRRSCIRFIARAEGNGVREATVSFARRSKVTDSRGRAVFCVRPGRRGTLTASVSKPGLRTARTTVRVRAAATPSSASAASTCHLTLNQQRHPARPTSCS
jgi:sugar lactone lactonase YvrE